MASFFKKVTAVVQWIGNCMDTFPYELWENNDTAESKQKYAQWTWDSQTGRPKNYANSDIVDTEAKIVDE